MKGYKTNVEKDSLENENFRKVLYTAKYSQLVRKTKKEAESEEEHFDGKTTE